MNRRQELDNLPVDARHLHKLMCRLFPRTHDYHPFDGAELVQEFAG